MLILPPTVAVKAWGQFLFEPSPSNTTTCKGGDALEYLQSAIDVINMSTDTGLQAMMSTVSNKRIEINFLQSTDPLYSSQHLPPGGIRFGWTAPEYQYSGNIYLHGVSLIDNCFDMARIKKNVTMNEKEAIITAIEATGDTTVPDIVEKIKSSNLELGTIIESYCKITQQNEVMAAVTDVNDRFENNELDYFPTLEELESLIHIDNTVSIYLVTDLLCDVYNYVSIR